MVRIYGIKNCDTVKKALKHLDQRGIDYEFIDFKKTAPTDADVGRWKKFVGDWPVNKRGRTFRALKEDFEDASDKKKLEMIQENTSLIHRPILEKSKKTVCLGYDKEAYEKL